MVRGGRITVAQQRALELLWPRYGIEFEPHALDLTAVFGRQASHTLEIGFGNGENLCALAAAHPERDYLGIEVHRPGIGRLLCALEAQLLSNVRLVCHDAVEVLRYQIGPATLDELLILFPDPWPKKRHHKRRLLQPPFVALVAERLKTGGVLRVATDWEAYAHWALAVCSGNAQLRNLSPQGTFVARPAQRNVTRFEQRGERLGHAIWDLAFERR